MKVIYQTGFAAALLLGVSGAAHAGTITLATQYTGGGLPQTTGFTGAFNFAQFDTSLGTLNSVELVLTETQGGTMNPNNPTTADATNADVTQSHSFTATIPNNISFSASGNYDLAVAAGFGTSFTVFHQTYLSSGTSTPGPAYNIFETTTNTDVLTSGLTPYEGIGTWALNYADVSKTFTSNTGGGVNANSNPTGLNSAYVIYNYTTPQQSAPEPASIALLGVSLAGLGVVRRRRRG